MGILLGAIADDYTGASDLANTLTKNGLRTVQTVGIPDETLALPDIDAVVVSLKIRSAPVAEAVSAAREANRWLRARGARHVLYKICSTFDSTDAGNIGPVTDALRDEARAGPVLVTPAFPETGRTVYLGHLFVGGQPLNESPLKDHPLNPMHDANLMRVLGRQSRAPVGLVDLFTIGAGPEAVKARLAALKATGTGAAIVDAVFERDLETVGEVALDEPFSTGASGLGLGLARALVRSGRVPVRTHDAPDVARAVGGLAAVIVGSCSKATLEQLAVAEASMPVLRLDPERLLTGPDEVAAALGWAGDRIADGPLVISASAPPDVVQRLQAKYGRDAAGHAIEAATSTIAAELVKRGVRRLVVAGGETSGAAVDRLGIPAFLVGPEIAPGVPVLRTIGNSQGDMLMALKSGNFGGRDFFAAALALMS
ncbi:MAG TPA: 3-oxo-tetronate kinase [Stellaceae bacterium]|nr:3-oxo-tetronate kinase [Stellaceae bacterium]